MRNITPVDLTLERLLAQSLSAVARSAPLHGRTVAHIDSILSQVARFFRRTAAIVCETVIEPASTSIFVDGAAITVGRLLVQCHVGRGVLGDMVTLIYSPRSLDRIELSVQGGNMASTARSGIAWAAELGWHFPSLGSPVDSTSHGEFLRNALFEIGLFSSTKLDLEPIVRDSGDAK